MCQRMYCKCSQERGSQIYILCASAHQSSLSGNVVLPMHTSSVAVHFFDLVWLRSYKQQNIYFESRFGYGLRVHGKWAFGKHPWHYPNEPNSDIKQTWVLVLKNPNWMEKRDRYSCHFVLCGRYNAMREQYEGE